MATGIQGYIGIGKEVTWGTPVASTVFVSATESISEERGRLREAMTFGTRSTLPAIEGRTRISGSISGLHARPGALGHLLRAAVGVPVTSGVGPYVHVFTPTTDKFSAEAALPPYSVTVERGSLRHRYAGGQVTQLTLRQPADDALTVDAEFLFQDVSDVASAETVALETNPRFIFRDLAITKDAVAFPYVEDLTLTIANSLSGEEVLNGTREIAATDFDDKLTVTLAMTLTFRDASTYADFRAATTAAYALTWTSGANVLAVDLPKVQIDSWGAPISGPGRLTVDVTATAEFDSVAGYEAEITLTNTTTSY